MFPVDVFPVDVFPASVAIEKGSNLGECQLAMFLSTGYGAGMAVVSKLGISGGSVWVGYLLNEANGR